MRLKALFRVQKRASLARNFERSISMDVALGGEESQSKEILFVQNFMTRLEIQIRSMKFGTSLWVEWRLQCDHIC